MPSKLSLYQRACQILGERRVASLSESSAMRRRLDTIYDAEGIKHCLGRGFWNFAMRSVEIEYSPSVDPDFGYQYAFDKPTDWVRTVIVATDEDFRCEAKYSDEVGYLWSDLQTLYFKYVSDDVQYGLDLSLWPPAFFEFVAHSFALKAAKATTGTAVDVDQIARDEKRALIAARSSDAMDESVQRTPSAWSRARLGRASTENG